jgi:hypothetical protein
VTGLVDVQPVLDSYGVDCSLASMFGINCTSCGNGNSTCIELDFEDPNAPLEAGLTIDPNPNVNDPSCN